MVLICDVLKQPAPMVMSQPQGLTIFSKKALIKQMIRNVPSHTELNNSALRLYFSAWGQIVDIMTMFHESPSCCVEIHNRKMVAVIDDTRGIGAEEGKVALDDLIRRVQSELQLAYNLIMQSQEIALKAKICFKSPFLLLLGQDVKSWAKKEADFMDFRTLDAADLVKVVNSISTTTLSERFVTNFEKLRRGRNKITHLGKHGDALDPVAVADLLAEQYLELYPKRNWLVDRARAATLGSASHFFDKRYNEKTSAIDDLVAMEFFLSEKQRRKLLGLPQEARLFSCPRCMHEARSDNNPADVRTAYLQSNESDILRQKLYCRLCDQKHSIYNEGETCIECGGDIILNSDDYRDLCCLCCKEAFQQE